MPRRANARARRQESWLVPEPGAAQRGALEARVVRRDPARRPEHVDREHDEHDRDRNVPRSLRSRRHARAGSPAHLESCEQPLVRRRARGRERGRRAGTAQGRPVGEPAFSRRPHGLAPRSRAPEGAPGRPRRSSMSSRCSARARAARCEPRSRRAEGRRTPSTSRCTSSGRISRSLRRTSVPPVRPRARSASLPTFSPSEIRVPARKRSHGFGGRKPVVVERKKRSSGWNSRPDEPGGSSS